MLTALRAAELYDGLADRPLPARTVIVEAGRIIGIASGDPALPSETAWLETEVAAPGFIDLQINGANGVLFNDAPTADSLAVIAEAARRGGAAHILPTFITAQGQAYRRAIDAATTARQRQVPGVLGFHLEGPFLSPERPGIHDAAAIRRIEDDDIDNLRECSEGVRLITLAPEAQPAGAIERLVAAGWTVFAGHSEAGFGAMTRAVAEGLRGVTHLFNAMAQITPREPGVVGSVLDHRQLFAGIIADGHHVHPANLRLAAATLGADRLCLVTDAMPTLGSHLAGFTLMGKPIRLAAGRLADGQDRLAGAHLSMIEAVRNMWHLAGCTLADSLRMASTAPAQALGLGDQLGRIQVGYRASLTCLDDGLRCRGVMTDGRWMPIGSEDAL